MPGLGLGLLWLGLGVVILVWQIPRTRTPALALGLLAAAVAGLVHGLIDVSYALPDLMLVWVLIFTLGAPSYKDR